MNGLTKEKVEEFLFNESITFASFQLVNRETRQRVIVEQAETSELIDRILLLAEFKDKLSLLILQDPSLEQICDVALTVVEKVDS